jgi:ribokinase
MKRPHIVVVGSINLDLVVQCTKLPQPGETRLATQSSEEYGGKGANQAVGAARAGGVVSMIGRVGDDAFGKRLIDNLVQNGVDSQCVRTTNQCASGIAIVAVESSGQNSIIVVPGANGTMTADDVIEHETLIASSDIVLLQCEVPLEVVVETIRIANRSGVRVILDPAPAPAWPGRFADPKSPYQVIPGISLICPNESEASRLTGLTIGSREQVEIAAKVLHEQGIEKVVVTLGEGGALLYDGREFHWIPPFVISPVDTTAAGDAFAGALAVRWSETDDLIEAVRFANAAGAIAATRRGAQQAMPSRKEIEELL